MDKKQERELRSKLEGMMRHQMVDELIKLHKEKTTEITRAYNGAIELFTTTSENFIAKVQHLEKYLWHKARVQETIGRIFELAETTKGQAEPVIIKRLEFLSGELAKRSAEQRSAAIETDEPLIMVQFDKWLSFVSAMQDDIAKVLDKRQRYSIEKLLNRVGDNPDVTTWQSILATIVIRHRDQDEARRRCAEEAHIMKDAHPHIYGKKFGMQKVALKLIEDRRIKSKLMHRLPVETQAEYDWLIAPYRECGYLVNNLLPDDFANRAQYGQAIAIIGNRLSEARREYESALSPDDN